MVLEYYMLIEFELFGNESKKYSENEISTILFASGTISYDLIETSFLYK